MDWEVILQDCLTALPFSVLNIPLQDILLTAVDLLKLEKLDIGGIRGRALSQQVQLLHQEFADTYKVFTERPCDCLDLNNKVEYHDHRGQDVVHIPFGKMLKVSWFPQAFYEINNIQQALCNFYSSILLSTWPFSKLANTTTAWSLQHLWSKLGFFSAQTDFFFFSLPSSRLTKMFLSYSKKSNLLCL